MRLGEVLTPGDLLNVTAFYALALTGSALCGGVPPASRSGQLRKAAGILFSLLAIFPPWALSHNIVRAFFTITLLIYFIRNSQMALDPLCASWPMSLRFSHTLWHFDHRFASPSPRRFSWPLMSRWLLNNLFASAVIFLRPLLPPSWLYPSYILSCVCFFFILSGLDCFLQWFALLFLGYTYSIPLMRSPYLSTSLAQVCDGHSVAISLFFFFFSRKPPRQLTLFFKISFGVTAGTLSFNRSFLASSTTPL